MLFCCKKNRKKNKKVKGVLLESTELPKQGKSDSLRSLAFQETEESIHEPDTVFGEFLFGSPETTIEVDKKHQNSRQPNKTFIKMLPGAHLGHGKLKTLVYEGFTPRALKNIICLGKKAVSIYASNQERIWFVQSIQLCHENAPVMLWIECQLPKKVVIVKDSILLVTPQISQITRISQDSKNPKKFSKTKVKFDCPIFGPKKNEFEIHGSIKNSKAVYASTKKGQSITLFSLSKIGISFIMNVPSEMKKLSETSEKQFSEEIIQKKKMLKRYSIRVRKGLRGLRLPKIFNFHPTKNSLNLVIRSDLNKINFMVFDSKNRKILRRKALTIFDILGTDLTKIVLKNSGSATRLSHFFKSLPDSIFQISDVDFSVEEQHLVGTITLTSKGVERNFVFFIREIFGRSKSSVKLLNDSIEEEQLCSKIEFHKSLRGLVYSKKNSSDDEGYSRMILVKLSSLGIKKIKLFDFYSENYKLDPNLILVKEIHDMGGNNFLLVGNDSLTIVNRVEEKIVTQLFTQRNINP